MGLEHALLLPQRTQNIKFQSQTGAPSKDRKQRRVQLCKLRSSAFVSTMATSMAEFLSAASAEATGHPLREPTVPITPRYQKFLSPLPPADHPHTTPQHPKPPHTDPYNFRNPCHPFQQFMGAAWLCSLDLLQCVTRNHAGCLLSRPHQLQIVAGKLWWQNEHLPFARKCIAANCLSRALQGSPLKSTIGKPHQLSTRFDKSMPYWPRSYTNERFNHYPLQFVVADFFHK